MSEEKIIEMLEDIMEVDEGTLKMDTILADIEEWDSLSKLSLMALAKKEFSKTLSAENIREMETVADIYHALV